MSSDKVTFITSFIDDPFKSMAVADFFNVALDGSQCLSNGHFVYGVAHKSALLVAAGLEDGMNEYLEERGYSGGVTIAFAVPANEKKKKARGGADDTKDKKATEGNQE